jgi:hypothetical protein
MKKSLVRTQDFKFSSQISFKNIPTVTFLSENAIREFPITSYTKKDGKE